MRTMESLTAWGLEIGTLQLNEEPSDFLTMIPAEQGTVNEYPLASLMVHEKLIAWPEVMDVSDVLYDVIAGF